MTRPVPARTPVVSPEQRYLPLTIEFQGMLLKILLQDREFGSALAKRILPAFFQNQVHAWTWAQALAYREKYWTFPTLDFLINTAWQLSNEQQRNVYCATIAQVRDQPITDEGGLRDAVLMFVRRNVFRKAWVESRDYFNAGKEDEAFDLMQEAMTELRAVSWAPDRRTWVGEGFIDRHVKRLDQQQNFVVPSGYPQLDQILGGGLRAPEVGIWLAGSKVGKTTWLLNLATNAVRFFRQPTLVLILEGNLVYAENRIDTIIADEQYANLKRGEIEGYKWQAAVREAEQLRGLFVVRDLTELDWQVNITHVDAELKALKQRHDFVPKLIVHDYVDLMRARTQQDSETQHQKQAMQDLKNLAGRGYAIWSACQVRRPGGDDADDVQEVVHSSRIADAYAKVRIADFIGSLNQTRQEREQGHMRVYAEMYRDGAANQIFYVRSDFAKMSFKPSEQQLSLPVSDASVQRTKQLGYGSLQQTRAPVPAQQRKNGV